MTTYNIVRSLGRGAFGRVELARTDTGRRFALKMFDPSPEVTNAVAAGHVSLDDLKRRFLDEAKYQQRIEHPNVVKVYESNLDNNPPFFVMELAEGSLAQDLFSDHTLGGTPHKALFDILAGLEAIHSQGLYHRDLKPANILRMRNSDGTTRYALSDFGLIKVATGDATTYTATGAQGGTERYAAPELMSDFKRATARSDVFSFGVILFDIFVGPVTRLPYTEVEFPGAVGLVASKCTKKLAARRYPSIPELRAALYDALKLEPPKFGSRKEERAVALLRSDDSLTEQDWDLVFHVLEEITATRSNSLDLLLRAFTKQHLEMLAADAPDLLAAFAGYYMDHVEEGRGRFDFDYCDVIADKLTWLFELGEIAAKARVLLVMLGLGVSHNRWFVERRFMQLAGPSLDSAVAERLLLDVDVKGIDVLSDIEHVERSIGTSRVRLSPALHRLWGSAIV